MELKTGAKLAKDPEDRWQTARDWSGLRVEGAKVAAARPPVPAVGWTANDSRRLSRHPKETKKSPVYANFVLNFGDAVRRKLGVAK
jgi:hypothetical protein